MARYLVRRRDVFTFHLTQFL